MLSDGAPSADEKTKLKDVQRQLHEKMYALIEPLFPNDPEKTDNWGRKYSIKKWTLDGVEVCRSAWQRVRGGSSRQHRMILAMVCRGHGPTDAAAHANVTKVVKALASVTDASGKRDTEKRGFAADWWKDYFMLCDFLPNEERIQIRGPAYAQLHEGVYGPMAVRVGMKLSYKIWRECAKEGLRLAAKLLPGSDPNRIKASRAARHSKFPECQACQHTNPRPHPPLPLPLQHTRRHVNSVSERYGTSAQLCQDRRKTWMLAARNIATNPAAVKEAYAAMLEHQGGWTADRAAALALRRSVFLPERGGVYECDDKCGSYWLALPVDPTGRDSKGAVSFLYRFAIQGNVICGSQGLIRFSVVPKQVSTGSNFGLTNIIMTLLRAKRKGRLGPHVKTLYRHTDGGSDNVSIATHILHWLLVYLGVFDELIWFRFEPGCAIAHVSPEPGCAIAPICSCASAPRKHSASHATQTPEGKVCACKAVVGGTPSLPHSPNEVVCRAEAATTEGYALFAP